MKASYYFIVEVENSYNNYKTLSNGLKIMTNNSIETVEAVNREGTIISAPRGVKAKKGDKVLFHHNICRRETGFKGAKRNSPFQLADNMFFVPITEVYMMDKGEGWKTVTPFVFLKPIEAKKVVLPNGLSIIREDYKGMNEMAGEIAFNNDDLKEQGINEGDVVAFKEYSQHEYEIDGEIYYRMTTNDILGKY